MKEPDNILVLNLIRPEPGILKLNLNDPQTASVDLTQLFQTITTAQNGAKLGGASRRLYIDACKVGKRAKLVDYLKRGVTSHSLKPFDTDGLLVHLIGHGSPGHSTLSNQAGIQWDCKDLAGVILQHLPPSAQGTLHINLIACNSGCSLEAQPSFAMRLFFELNKLLHQRQQTGIKLCVEGRTGLVARQTNTVDHNYIAGGRQNDGDRILITSTGVEKYVYSGNTETLVPESGEQQKLFSIYEKLMELQSSNQYAHQFKREDEDKIPNGSWVIHPVLDPKLKQIDRVAISLKDQQGKITRYLCQISGNGYTILNPNQQLTGYTFPNMQELKNWCDEKTKPNSGPRIKP